MFQGEKTLLFWVGLIIVAFASLAIFSIVWNAVVNYLLYVRPYGTFLYSSFVSGVPIIVGGVIFIIVGLYMMKSGVKKTKPTQ